MPVVLAGVAAAAFGVADFLGGTAARRAPAAVVAMLAQLAGLGALLIVLVAIPASLMPAAAVPSALGWGILAGLAGGIGVPLMYKGLAEGPMNVVAPLTALTSAAVPVIAGAAMGERPSTMAWIGVALAVVAGVLVGVTIGSGKPVGESLAPSRQMARGVLLALFAGTCFGGFFVLLAQATPGAGLWPVATAKVSGSLVAGVGLLFALRAGGLTLGVPRGLESGRGWLQRTGTGWRLAVLCGVLDGLSNGVYLLSVHGGGQLSVVGAIVALYPASTVLLARWLHGERIGPLQRVGLLLAIPALVMVSGG